MNAFRRIARRIICCHKTEEVPENDDFVEDEEEDEVDVDDKFKYIEEENFEQNNATDSNDTNLLLSDQVGRND
jgi:hypothetical protein